MAFIPTIVGLIFLFVGQLLLLDELRRRREATEVEGRVRAIEKYQTVISHSNNEKVHATLYRPVVDYSWEQEARSTYGAGVSAVRHRLGDVIPVLVEAGPDGQMIGLVKDMSQFVFAGLSAALGLAGLILGLVFLKLSSSNIAGIIPSAIVLSLGLAWLLTGRRLIQTSAPKEYTDSVVFDTQEALDKEVQYYSRIGLVICVLLLVGSLALGYFGLQSLPKPAIELLQNNSSEFFSRVSDGPPTSWKKPLVLLGAGIFFALVSIIGAIRNALA